MGGGLHSKDDINYWLEMICQNVNDGEVFYHSEKYINGNRSEKEI